MSSAAFELDAATAAQLPNEVRQLTALMPNLDLTRALSQTQPTLPAPAVFAHFHSHAQPEPASPTLSQSSAQTSVRTARVASLLAEFDTKFLVTDPDTGQKTYPQWTIPFVKEMVRTLEQSKQAPSQPQLLPWQLEQTIEMKRGSSSSRDLSRRSTLKQSDTAHSSKNASHRQSVHDEAAPIPPLYHKRYDSILDQYYPNKHAAIQSQLNKQPVTKSALRRSVSDKREPVSARSNKSALNTARPAISRTVSARPAVTASRPSLVRSTSSQSTQRPSSQSHGHSTDGCEAPQHKIRVTKLHEAMVEQINMLSQSLNEAWQRLSEREQQDSLREQQLNEALDVARDARETAALNATAPFEVHDPRVDAHVMEVEQSREWREWSRDRMASLMQQVEQLMLSQSQATMRVRTLESEQSQLRHQLEQAQRAITAEQIRHSEDLHDMHLRHIEEHTNQTQLVEQQQHYSQWKSEMELRVESLMCQIQDLEREKHALNDLLHSMRDNHNESKASLLEQLAALTAEAEQLKHRAEVLERENQSLMNANSEEHGRHAAAANQLTEHSLLLTATRQSLSETEAKLCAESDAGNTHRLRADELQQQLQQTQDKIAELTQQLEEHKRKDDDEMLFQQQTSKAQQQSAPPTASAKKADGGERVALMAQRMLVSHMRSKLQSLQAQLLAANRALSESHIHSPSQSQQQLQQLQSLQSQVASLQSEMTSRTQAFDALQSQHQSLQSQHSDTQTELRATLADLASVDALNTQLLTQHDCLQSKFTEFSKFLEFSQSSMHGDYLSARTNSHLSSMLTAHGDKVCLFSDLVQRIDSHNRRLDRALLVSEASVYVLGPHSVLLQSSDISHFELKRRISPNQIQSVSLSRYNAQLLVLTLSGGYDQAFLTDKRNEIVHFLLCLEPKLKVMFAEELFVRDRDLLHQRLIRVTKTQQLELSKQRLVSHTASK